MEADIERHARHDSRDTSRHRGTIAAPDERKSRTAGSIENIASIARVIGFSPQEVAEIEAVYRMTPDQLLK